MNGAGAGDTGARVVAESVSAERGGTVPEGDDAPGAVGTHGVANNMLEGSPDVWAVVGVAMVVSDSAVAETEDTGDVSVPRTRGRRG